jgi:hypothetical protein
MSRYIMSSDLHNMTQTRRDDKLKRVLGERLRELVDDHLAIGWEDLAVQLGYANSSTLRRVRDGDSFLSVEKMARLAAVTAGDGRRVSVDWLLTGLGDPLRDAAPTARNSGGSTGVGISSRRAQQESR